MTDSSAAEDRNGASEMASEEFRRSIGPKTRGTHGEGERAVLIVLGCHQEVVFLVPCIDERIVRSIVIDNPIAIVDPVIMHKNKGNFIILFRYTANPKIHTDDNSFFSTQQACVTTRSRAGFTQFFELRSLRQGSKGVVCVFFNFFYCLFLSYGRRNITTPAQQNRNTEKADQVDVPSHYSGSPPAMIIPIFRNESVPSSKYSEWLDSESDSNSVAPNSSPTGSAP